MPWKSFLTGDEYCVFLLDEEGEQTGESLGCHETEDEANDQVAALNASEDEERAVSLFRGFWESLSQLIQGNESGEIDRAIPVDALHEMAWDAAMEKYPQAWLHTVFTEDDGSLFAILSQDGLIYKSPITLQDGVISELGDWVQVTQEFPEVQTRTTIQRQADGRYRWFSVSATSTLNRVGEIDSRDLFDSFVAHIEKTGEYPTRQFYHQGDQFRTGLCDFVARDGNALITSGLYDETPFATLEIEDIERDPGYWGESIRYKPTAPPDLLDIGGFAIPVFRSGILVEITSLPEAEAANLFTTTAGMEVSRMSLKGKVWDAFLKRFQGDEERALGWLEENVDETNRAIEDENMIARETPDPETSDPEDKGTPEIILEEAAVEAMVQTTLESEPITQMREAQTQIDERLVALVAKFDETLETLKDLGVRVKGLEKDEADKKREYQEDMPRKQPVTVTYRPSQMRVNDQEVQIVPANEKAAENRPKNAY